MARAAITIRVPRLRLRATAMLGCLTVALSWLCPRIYVGEGYRGDLHEVISSLGHRPVLVVTDEAYGLEAGGMVNFVIADGRVRFEVSLTSATRAGLKISSQLLAVAVRVQTG